MAENPMEEMGIEETWSFINDNLGVNEVVELIPNGSNIIV
jgi:hypothetical protein